MLPLEAPTSMFRRREKAKESLDMRLNCVVPTQRLDIYMNYYAHASPARGKRTQVSRSHNAVERQPKSAFAYVTCFSACLSMMFLLFLSFSNLFPAITKEREAGSLPRVSGDVIIGERVAERAFVILCAHA